MNNHGSYWAELGSLEIGIIVAEGDPRNHTNSVIRDSSFSENVNQGS